MLLRKICAAVSALPFWVCCEIPALAQTAYPDDCTMSVDADWTQEITANASTTGACGLGDLALTLRDRQDRVIWSGSYRTKDLFGFYDVFTPLAMQAALTDWITTFVDHTSTGRLPEWSAGMDSPIQGEFPFYPADGLNRDRYIAARDLDGVMICFVQGQESSLCLTPALDGAQWQEIGYQTFPG